MERVSLPMVLLVASVAAAVTPAIWQDTTEADFEKGKFDSTGVTSHGVVTPARKIDILVGADRAPAVVSAVAAAGDVVCAADGAGGGILRIEGGKVTKITHDNWTVVTSLLWTGGELLVGTGGKGAGIYRVDAEGAVSEVWTDAKVLYVWAIRRSADGTLYAATGPQGRAYAVSAEGKGEAIYEAGKLAKNILSLALSEGNLLYAGTDDNGLVVEIDPKTRTSRIILDTPEKEISALVTDGAGGLFVATADAAKAAANGKVPPSSEKAGKADTKPAAGAPSSGPASTAPAGIAPTTAPGDNRGAAPAPAAGQAASVPADDEPTSRAAPEPQATAPAPPEQAPAQPERAATPTPAAAPNGKGNAVYHIRPDGLVNTIFRRPVTVLAMLAHDGKLILGTGNGGAIYSVTTDGDEIARLADTDARQVTALATAGDGAVVFATSNKGSVGRLSKAPAESGEYTSRVFDAGQVARWGTVQVAADVPAGAKLTFATRTGNVAEPDEKTWSSWSKELPVRDGFLALTGPSGRFCQYRLRFTSPDGATPAVRRVRIIHQVGNLAPVVAAVQVQPTAKAKGGGPGPGALAFRLVAVKAADPNRDKINYTFEFRQVGSTGWIRIAEKLKSPKYVWDTRKVGDGTYELRVTASDSPANPSSSALEGRRISEPIVVDNTAPVVRELVGKPGGRKVSVTGVAADASSRIVAIHYAVDSQDEWVTLLPTDGICDSDREKFAFDTDDLDPGAHRIAVRVVDLYGNEGYSAITITVGK